MRVDTTIPGLKFADGLMSFTSFKPDKSKKFDRTIHEIRDEILEVHPYLVQDAKYERVASDSMYSYLLIPTINEDEEYLDLLDELGEELEGEIECKEAVVSDNGLLVDINEFEPDEENSYVVLIDGDSYTKRTINALPNWENVFVLFSPYRAAKTMPVSEAKRYLQRKGEEKAPNQKFARVSLY